MKLKSFLFAGTLLAIALSGAFGQVFENAVKTGGSFKQPIIIPCTLLREPAKLC
jgi:hypothetical protein